MTDDVITKSLKPKNFKIAVPELIAATLAINILALAVPVLTLQLYDRILPNPGSGTLPVMIAGVSVAIVMEGFLRLARAYLIARSGAVYEHRMSCGMINYLLQVNIASIGGAGIGEQLNRLSAISKLKDFYNGYAMTAVLELAFLPVFLVVVAYIAGPLAIVPAALLMAFALVSLAQGQSLRFRLHKRDKMDDARYDFLIESLQGIHTIKSMVLERRFERRYEALEEASSFRSFKVAEAAAASYNTGTIFSHAMVIAVTCMGAFLTLEGQITTGSLIASVLLSGRMMQPLQKALGIWTRYQDFSLARQKVETIFEIPRHVSMAANDADPSREGILSIRNVGFRHLNADRPLLKNISLDVRRGECLSISADNDEAKDALLDLIAGLYPPSEGEIDIDGLNVLRYPPERLIRHVGYIRAEGLIFRGTIRDNMTCFGLIPETEAQEMAALLNVTRDIAKLPAGFDTMLSGNSGDVIPPGLKQRIAMVRVLAPKPRLILYDNADHGLDRAGYGLIYSLFSRIKGKASLILLSEDKNIQALAERRLILDRNGLREVDAYAHEKAAI